MTTWLSQRLQVAFVLAIACAAATTPHAHAQNVPTSETRSILFEQVANLGKRVINMANAGDGSGRLFIAHGDGTVRIRQANGTLLATPFFNVPAHPSERGLGSIVFHPDYASNGRLFVITGEQLNTGTPHYSPGHGDMTAGAFDNVIYEYQVDPNNPNRVDPNSKRELLRLQIPGSIHNIDDLTFGNDGHLYVSIGDSGPTDAPNATYYLNGQDTTTPFGSVLRLDVDADPNGPGGNGRYVIPSDNPFADGANGNVPEIFAWGFRNPWRISTDPVTGKIFTGDNGERGREEVNLVELGNNYGWAIKEGTYLYNPITRNISPDPNPDPALTDPFAEYGRLDGRSIIGGYVYRGSLMPQFYGDYFFADYVMRKLFVMNIDTGELEVIPIDLDGAAFNSNAITFGEDEWGELYLGFENGRVYRLVPEPTSLALLVLGGVTLFGRRRHPRTA